MQLLATKRRTGGDTEEDAGRKSPRRRLSKRRVALLAVALALAAGSAFGVKALFFSTEERVALTENTTYGTLSTTIEGTGTTLPADSVTVTTASTAEILEVCVSAGDTVEAGDLLYVQDDGELDSQIEEYEDEIAALEEELEGYEEQLDELSESIAALTVTAPFSGRITQVEADVGGSVMSGARLATLVDDSRMTLTQYFSYAYEEQIVPGMPAYISFPSLMQSLEGAVTDIRKVDRVTAEGTRCFAVTVTLDNPGALAEGMTGAGYLLAGSGEKIYPAVEGALECCASQDVTAGASGELTAVNVADYERVSAGQTLFLLDGADYQNQAESVRKKIAQAQDRIASYEEKIAETGEKRSDYAVRAEISGKVIMVAVRAGEKPRQAGQTAVSIYNLDTMTITANIDELDIGSIGMGMEVAITRSGAEADTSYTGTVTEISYEATNSNGVAYFPITITIPSGGALAAGVNVAYAITVGDASEGVLAPISALKNTGAGTCLFVKADARPENAVDLEDADVPDGFYAVPVEVGVMNARYARILSGVEEGAEVFTRYRQSAPSGGDTTSQGQEGEENTQSGFGGGAMPDFSGGGGGMPSFGGGGGMGPMG